jgi:SAM-dependent methyltransferase
VSDPALRQTLLDALDEPIGELRETRPSVGRSFRNALWTLRTRLADLLFDRGIDTAGIQYQGEHLHSDNVRYEASGWSYLPRALPRDSVSGSDVFLDIGSGKGRVIYQAARYPFRRVMGVEVSEELNEVAHANIETRRRKLVCQDIELVTADAAGFDIPDDVTVAYLFYPFVGDTFRAVMGKLVESLDRRPRRLRLIYVCPKLEDEVLATGRFGLERRIPGGRRDVIGRRICVYASVAAADRAA